MVSDHFTLEDRKGRDVPLGELFDLQFRSAKLREPLLRDLGSVVREKAISAYESVRVPCIVEHAGLVFADLAEHSYPGGLTQPMWDALTANRFVRMKGVAGSRVIARAIVGYCDGMAVHLFQGETEGVIADLPRGKRAFYWDNVFCPEGGNQLTYAEIADKQNGLLEKMRLSQSQKAIMAFLRYRFVHKPKLFT